MQKLRIRPDNSYLKQASWEQLYVLSEHWLSDTAFFTDELNFFRDLINKYFLSFVDKEHIGRTQVIGNKISELESRNNRIKNQIKEHMKHISEISKRTEKEGLKFREEHADLEDNIAELSKDFRETKKDLFDLSNEVIGSEKLKHLLKQ